MAAFGLGGLKFAVVSAASLLASTATLGDLIIDVSYTGDTQYQSAFTGAADTWEGLLGGYQDGMITSVGFGSSAVVGQEFSTVSINASVVTMDGAGGQLGQAQFDSIAIDTSGFFLATDGTMTFDVADVANLQAAGLFETVVVHEIAHVLGFGTLWSANGVYSSALNQYTGTNATLEWQNEFGQSGNPTIEAQGGPGTASVHWDEVFEGAALTGITDSMGQ